MAFTPYYPGGWQSGEEGGTPITPDALNHYDDAFDDVYDAIQQSTAFEIITDFNTFKPLDSTRVTRRYGLCTGDSAANAPFSGNNETFRGYVEGISSYFTQHFTSEYSNLNSKEGRECVRVCINGTFLPWRQTISTIPLKTVSNNGGTLTINISNYTAIRITTTSYRVDDMGVALITYGINGSMAKKWIGTEPSNVSVTAGSGVITITNNDATNDLFVLIEQIRGGTVSV